MIPTDHLHIWNPHFDRYSPMRVDPREKDVIKEDVERVNGLVVKEGQGSESAPKEPPTQEEIDDAARKKEDAK